jgi:hypothetical protein
MRGVRAAAETCAMSCAEFTPELPYPLDRPRRSSGEAAGGPHPVRRLPVRSLLMKTSIFLFVAAPILLPAFGLVHRLNGNDVEHAIRHQMNGSPAGVITQRVDCAPLREVASASYSCTLVGKSGSTARARVTVSDSGWRADWAPIKG